MEYAIQLLPSHPPMNRYKLKRPKGGPSQVFVGVRMQLPFGMKTVDGGQHIDCSLRFNHHARRIKEAIEARTTSFSLILSRGEAKTSKRRYPWGGHSIIDTPGSEEEGSTDICPHCGIEAIDYHMCPSLRNFLARHCTDTSPRTDRSLSILFDDTVILAPKKRQKVAGETPLGSPASEEGEGVTTSSLVLEQGEDEINPD